MKTEYEIVECKNGKAIPVFADMCAKIKDWGYDREELITYFEARFGLPDFKVFVEPHLWGMMAVQEILWVAKRHLSIEFIWVNPKKPGLMAEFMKAAEDLARTMGIKNILGTVKRPSLMKRYANGEQERYGFSPEAIIIIKEVKGG